MFLTTVCKKYYTGKTQFLNFIMRASKEREGGREAGRQKKVDTPDPINYHYITMIPRSCILRRLPSYYFKDRCYQIPGTTGWGAAQSDKVLI